MAKARLGVPTRSESEAASLIGRYSRGAWECLSYFLPLLAPHWHRVLLVCLVDLVQIFLQFVPPLIVLRIVDQALAQRNGALALELCLLLFGVQLTVQGVIWARNMLFQHLEWRVQFELRQRLFVHLQRVSVAYLESSPVGQRVFRLRIDSDSVGSAVAGFFPAVMRFVEFLLILLAITALDPLVTAISLAFLAPWAVFLLLATSVYRRLDRHRLLLAEHRDSGVLQGVTSFDLIKSFGRIRWELLKHGTRSVKTQRIANQHYTFWWLVDLIVVRLLPHGRTLSVTYLSYVKVIQGQLTLGQTIPMIAFVLRIGEPITQLIEFINTLRRSMIAAERCIQILEVQSAVPEPAHPRPLGEVRGEVALEDVRFSHLDGTEVIKGVTARFPAGEVTAIVGGSGAGKSTLASLVLRLHDPSSGRVLVDGQDIREVSRHRLYQSFAVVTQEAFVFGGTLSDNLKVGKEEASPGEMREALRRVGLASWSDSLPLGLETDLESGGALSVGQRQRLGIARALLADPRVLILDEPTSALDSQTESQVMEAICEAAKGRTTLLITHRLNTASFADQVVVMENGSVAESGPPSQLAASGGAYSCLLQSFYGSQK